MQNFSLEKVCLESTMNRTYKSKFSSFGKNKKYYIRQKFKTFDHFGQQNINSSTKRVSVDKNV